MHFYPGELPRHPADRKHLRIDVHQSLVQIIGVAVDNVAQADLSSERWKSLLLDFSTERLFHSLRGGRFKKAESVPATLRKWHSDVNRALSSNERTGRAASTRIASASRRHVKPKRQSA